MNHRMGMFAVAVPLVVGAVTGPTVRAQSAQPATASTPKFEVASIRPCAQDQPSPLAAASPGRYSSGCRTLPSLIYTAYMLFANGHLNRPGLPGFEGGPSWINSDRFVIDAKAENNTSLEMMQGPMLQALLEDRFQLKVHRETREVPAYALVVKNEAKLRQHEERSCKEIDLVNPGKPADTAPGETPRCMGSMISRNGATFTVNIVGYSLDRFWSVLRNIGGIDRPVVDKTGITGIFTFKLLYAGVLPDGFPPAVPDPDLPSMTTAIEEELGLKLEPSKGPQDYLVIEHVEKPSEN
jgi:uncharacterized protein (TIGR03435 family)